MRIRLLAFLTFFSVFFFSFSLVHAVTMPSARDVFVMPGDSVTLSVPVENTLDRSIEVPVSLFSVELPTGDSEEPTLSSLFPEEAAWISFSPTLLLLSAHEKSLVSVTFQPNSGISPGVYAVALVSTERLDGEIPLEHGSATLIFVTVGDLVSSGKCLSFTREDGNRISFQVENSGRGILYEEGNAFLRGPFGVVFRTVPINPDEHRVLPGQTRTWSFDAPTVPWWSFGPLTIALSEDESGQTCAPIAYGFGWRLLGGVTVLCALIFVGIALRRRH